MRVCNPVSKSQSKVEINTDYNQQNNASSSENRIKSCAYDTKKI